MYYFTVVIWKSAFTFDHRAVQQIVKLQMVTPST